jgi:hypothetical protein
MIALFDINLEFVSSVDNPDVSCATTLVHRNIGMIQTNMFDAIHLSPKNMDNLWTVNLM